MSIPRLISFAVLTIFGSLLQLFVVVIILLARRSEVIFSDILSDGSLFFFSTSTVFISWFSISSAEKKQNAEQPSFVITILCVGFVTILSIVLYSSAAYEIIQKKNLPFPKDNYMYAQFVCAGVAISYAFYASAFIGLFSKTGLPQSDRNGQQNA